MTLVCCYMSAGSWLYHQYTHPYLAERHEGKEGLAADNESTAGEPGNLYHLDLLIVHKNKGMHKGRQDVSRKFLKTRVGGCVHATLLTPLEWDYRLSLRLRLSSLTTHSTSISIHVPMDRWAWEQGHTRSHLTTHQHSLPCCSPGQIRGYSCTQPILGCRYTHADTRHYWLHNRL